MCCLYGVLFSHRKKCTLSFLLLLHQKSSWRGENLNGSLWLFSMISSTAKSCMIFSTAYFLENHWKQAQNIEPKVALSKEIMDKMKDKMSIFKLSEVIKRVQRSLYLGSTKSRNSSQRLEQLGYLVTGRSPDDSMNGLWLWYRLILGTPLSLLTATHRCLLYYVGWVSTKYHNLREHGLLPNVDFSLNHSHSHKSNFSITCNA